jgi:hypothetical protein
VFPAGPTTAVEVPLPAEQLQNFYEGRLFISVQDTAGSRKLRGQMNREVRYFARCMPKATPAGRCFSFFVLVFLFVSIACSRFCQSLPALSLLSNSHSLLLRSLPYLPHLTLPYFTFFP